MTNKERYIEAVKELIERYKSHNMGQIVKYGSALSCPLCKIGRHTDGYGNLNCLPCPMAVREKDATGEIRFLEGCCDYFDVESGRMIHSFIRLQRNSYYNYIYLTPEKQKEAEKNLLYASDCRAKAYQEVLRVLLTWSESRFTQKGWKQHNWNNVDGKKLLEAGK